MFISVAAASSKGNVRVENEDNYYIAGEYVAYEAMNAPCKMLKTLVDDGAPVICAVCDGMGGGSDGGYASHKVVSMLRNELCELDPIRDEAAFTNALRHISGKIERYAAERQLRLVGSTLVTASFLDGCLRACNVGDSRAYILRGRKLSQLSMDHSEVQRMVNMGILTKAEAAVSPRRHVITQYMGMPSDEIVISPYYSEIVRVLEGDRILLCSDGITDMVDDETLQLLLSTIETPERAADAVVDAALQRGGADNATAIVAFAQERAGKSAKENILLS